MLLALGFSSYGKISRRKNDILSLDTWAIFYSVISIFLICCSIRINFLLITIKNFIPLYSVSSSTNWNDFFKKWFNLSLRGCQFVLSCLGFDSYRDLRVEDRTVIEMIFLERILKVLYKSYKCFSWSAYAFDRNQ